LSSQSGNSDEMTKNQDPASEQDGTRVDLGDDLLEKTAMLSKSEPSMHEMDEKRLLLDEVSDSPTLAEGIDDVLESAKILMNEGLLDDAKKNLHRVLIADPNNWTARQQLQEIQDLELKQILGGEEVRRPFHKRNQSVLSEESDSDFIARQLDQDLNLGIFSDNPELPALSENEIDGVFSRVEKNLTDSNALPQDWIDLGIAFFEMDLHSVAAHLFSGACKRLNSEAPEEFPQFLSASSLLAYALILSGRPYDAISKIQPLISDSKILLQDKAELFYLMGRSYEQMRRYDLAGQFYHRVMEIDPYYRDIYSRLRRKRE
jgi:tetratricopeptide (TPR) repeat protein